MADLDPASMESASGEFQTTNASASSATEEGKAPDKTISCVSCRRRKLKCDRSKPKCGTCRRLRHECEYPERRRNMGSKRRNMKELEARLAQVETKLVSETQAQFQPVTQSSKSSIPEPDFEIDWNNFPDGMDMNLEDVGLNDGPFVTQQSAFGFGQMPSLLNDGNFSNELISLGLQEPLPPQEMIDELHSIYFEIYHTNLPTMHKYRYLASLDLPPHMRPPVCLQYAIWTTAASMSDKYACYEGILYERARRYTEAAEMKGHGESFVTIQHAQTWGLIGHFEAKKTYFSRSWMSIGRMTRLVFMLGLHRIDTDKADVKQILPPARDWIELEERRRTFWSAFYGDRWASSGTGWPMMINEKEILTNFPSSEESFEKGVPLHDPITLEQILAADGIGHVSPFGGVLLSAAFFGHNFNHIRRASPDEHTEDVSNGDYWKRHRKMDNVLSNTFMFLPDHLRLPTGLRDVNVVFLHMSIHASIICLHQAAVITAEKHSLGLGVIRQSRNRCLMAAEEISNIMHLVSHVDAGKMSSWLGFCLYIAGGVFVKDKKSEKPHPQGLANLDFLLSAMRALSKKHPVTSHFTNQMELDMNASGIIPNIPINGLLAERRGAPMTVGEIHGYAQSPQSQNNDQNRSNGVSPHSGNASRSDSSPQDFSTDSSSVSARHLDPWTKTPIDPIAQASYHAAGGCPGGHSIPPSTATASNASGSSSSIRPTGSTSTTLSCDAPTTGYSTASIMSFPFRKMDPALRTPAPEDSWKPIPPNPSPFPATPEWTTLQNGLEGFDTQQPPDLNSFLEEDIWNPDPNFMEP